MVLAAVLLLVAAAPAQAILPEALSAVSAFLESPAAEVYRIDLPELELPEVEPLPIDVALPTLAPEPEPVLAIAPTPVKAGFTCSSDADGLVVHIRDTTTGHALHSKWDWGDGQVDVAFTRAEAPTQHVYTQPGNYWIQLTVRDMDNERHVVRHPCRALPEPQVVFMAGGFQPPADPPKQTPTLEPIVFEEPLVPVVPALPKAASAPVPLPETAVGQVALGYGAAALVAVGAYAAWPRILRFLGFLAFTRIETNDLLEHPVRQEVFDTIEGDPGIHFQALVRATGRGNGVLEHHLRMLTHAGLVRQRQAGGYTCYFPAAMDRKVMEASSVLKADIARSALDKIMAAPGLAVGELASSLGVTPKAVRYHLDRFEAAGLVRREKVGRSVHVYPGAIATQLPVAVAA